MKLTLKPSEKNHWPTLGVLIKGSSPKQWLFALKEANIPLDTIQVFALPGLSVNTVGGCLALPLSPEHTFPSHSLFTVQQVAPQVFISAYSRPHPPCSPEELQQLFPEPVLMHPELGTVTLGTPVTWSDLLASPTALPSGWQQPAKTITLPRQLRSIRLAKVDPEEVLKRLDAEAFPQTTPKNEAPLSRLERLRLRLYKLLRKGKKRKEGKDGINSSNHLLSGKNKPTRVPRTKLGQWWARMEDRVNQRVQEDLEELERRNNKEADKLVDMFKKDMHEALKWAIPLGNEAAPPGGGLTSFRLTRHNQQLGGSSRGGGRAVMGQDTLFELRQQYVKAAKELEQEGDFVQASFVYLKLLKDYHAADDTLRKGKKFPEAAAIYLKYCHKEKAAAECYVEGHMPLEAIPIYQKLKEHEKAGDLYWQMGERDPALEEYEQALHDLKHRGHHRMAGDLVREKMEDLPRALSNYLEGWEGPAKDAACVRSYLQYQPDEPTLGKELARLDDEMVSKDKLDQWVSILMEEYHRDRTTRKQAEELVYQRIANDVHLQPKLARHLREFFPEDVNLKKDTIRFGLRKKK
ncbi:MAG TPA: hypothetical protein DCE41_22175 [Cytophagales bacterium]|nr:hypothetical protein [Cytophagales bacterium]